MFTESVVTLDEIRRDSIVDGEEGVLRLVAICIVLLILFRLVGCRQERFLFAVGWMQLLVMLVDVVFGAIGEMHEDIGRCWSTCGHNVFIVES